MFCVSAKFVDIFQAQFGHPLRRLFQYGKTQNAKIPTSADNIAKQVMETYHT